MLFNLDQLSQPVELHAKLIIIQLHSSIVIMYKYNHCLGREIKELLNLPVLFLNYKAGHLSMVTLPFT